MLTKEQIIATIDNMPDEITIDELIDKLVFINKVQTGLEQSEKGNVLTTDEAKQKLGKWLK